MSMPLVSRPAPLAALLGALVVLASPAAADKYFGAAGGGFVPYSGEIGWTVLMEMGGDLPNEHFRLGGELLFATQNTDVNVAAYGAGTGSVETTLRIYQLNLVGRYILFPGKLSPYLGATGGFSVLELDDANLVAAVGNTALLSSTSGLGISGGLGGLIGLEVPMFSRDLNLFVEGRADYSWEFTGNLAPVAGPSDFNGVSIVLGMRGRF
jgi:hypothetical protein